MYFFNEHSQVRTYSCENGNAVKYRLIRGFRPVLNDIFSRKTRFMNNKQWVCRIPKCMEITAKTHGNNSKQHVKSKLYGAGITFEKDITLKKKKEFMQWFLNEYSHSLRRGREVFANFLELAKL